jgi:hypothetical protein
LFQGHCFLLFPHGCHKVSFREIEVDRSDVVNKGSLRLYLRKNPNASREPLVNGIIKGLRYLHGTFVYLLVYYAALIAELTCMTGLKPSIVHGDLKAVCSRTSTGTYDYLME